MTDIVKYQNELNLDPQSYPVFKLTEIEQNIFMALLSQTTFNNDQWVRTNLYDLREKISYYSRSMDSFIDEIDNLLEKICSQKIKIKRGSKVFLFVCFDKLVYDEKTNDLAVHFQDDFYKMVKNYQLGFTRFELAEFVSLSGAYAKTLYRQLKQYRSQGWWYVELADFKRLLNIPETYQMCDLNKRVLNPCIKQLSRESDLIDEATGSKRIPFKNLSVRKISERKRGQTGRGAVTALKFTFEPQQEFVQIGENIECQDHAPADHQAAEEQEIEKTGEVSNEPQFDNPFVSKELQPQVEIFNAMSDDDFIKYYIIHHNDPKDRQALTQSLTVHCSHDGFFEKFTAYQNKLRELEQERKSEERREQFNNALNNIE